MQDNLNTACIRRQFNPVALMLGVDPEDADAVLAGFIEASVIFYCTRTGDDYRPSFGGAVVPDGSNCSVLQASWARWT